MQEYPLEESMLLYIPALFILAYWLYKMHRSKDAKKESYEEQYDNVIKSDKYKVKGKFEFD